MVCNGWIIKMSVESRWEQFDLTFLNTLTEVVDVVIDKKTDALESDRPLIQVIHTNGFVGNFAV